MIFLSKSQCLILLKDLLESLKTIIFGFIYIQIQIKLVFALNIL